MKITIDTKEDSHVEIRNIIKMLSSLVSEKPLTNSPNIFDDSSPEVKPAVQGNIFENSSPEVKPASQENIFGNMFDSPGPAVSEKKAGEEPTIEEEPKIEEKEEPEDEPSVSEYY